MSSTGSELPNVAEILGQVLQRVPQAHAPLLIALAERMAAVRYRRWATEVSEPTRSVELLACADREEEIARQVEALHPDAASVQADLLAANPDLEDIDRSIFAGRPLPQQFTIQAQGERLGAATWRSFAGQAGDAKAREVFLRCADLEEESAACLESFLRWRGTSS